MPKYIQVNASMDEETANQLDQLAHDMGYETRSSVVRWLVRREWERRFQKPKETEAQQPEPIQS